MIWEDFQALKTGRRELRNFGLLVGGVLAALGLWLTLRQSLWAPWVWWPGLILFLLGALAPTILKRPYLAWMFLALVLGFIVSHLILGVFFFCVITPVGWVARLVGKDFLRLRRDPQATSYWITREDSGPKNPADYERQF